MILSPSLLRKSHLPRAVTVVATGVAFALLAGCATARNMAGAGQTLAQARQGHTTQLTAKLRNDDAIDTPPAGIKIVHYPAPLGSYPAYLTAPPTSGKRYPAIIWLVGGFGNSLIGNTAWLPAPPENDQSARAFREAGIITMYPSLRGGNGNAGYDESFYGEVDDVIAAAKYLATRSDVDPNRIYLGGHSTGGTLALLTAECTNRFRGVFAFGAVASPVAYGAGNLTFDTSDKTEKDLRAPYRYINTISTPTFLFEGTEQPSNLKPLRILAYVDKNPLVHCYELPGYNHFSELAEFTPIVASQIARDTSATPQFAFQSTNPEIVPAQPAL